MNVGKKRKSIPENLPYCEVLYALAKEPLYLSQVHEQFGISEEAMTSENKFYLKVTYRKSLPAIRKLLINLVEEGYVSELSDEAYKKKYTVEWNKIISLFFEVYKKQVIDEEKDYIKYFKFTELEKSPILIEYFKEVFTAHHNYNSLNQSMELVTFFKHIIMFNLLPKSFERFFDVFIGEEQYLLTNDKEDLLLHLQGKTNTVLAQDFVRISELCEMMARTNKISDFNQEIEVAEDRSFCISVANNDRLMIKKSIDSLKDNEKKKNKALMTKIPTVDISQVNEYRETLSKLEKNFIDKKGKYYNTQDKSQLEELMQLLIKFRKDYYWFTSSVYKSSDTNLSTLKRDMSIISEADSVDLSRNEFRSDRILYALYLSIGKLYQYYGDRMSENKYLKFWDEYFAKAKKIKLDFY